MTDVKIRPWWERMKCDRDEGIAAHGKHLDNWTVLMHIQRGDSPMELKGPHEEAFNRLRDLEFIEVTSQFRDAAIVTDAGHAYADALCCACSFFLSNMDVLEQINREWHSVRDALTVREWGRQYEGADEGAPDDSLAGLARHRIELLETQERANERLMKRIFWAEHVLRKTLELDDENLSFETLLAKAIMRIRGEKP